MKIKFTIILFIFLILSLIILLIPNNCKSLNAFKSFLDFKGVTYYDCISSKTFKKSLSNKLAPFPGTLDLIYKILNKNVPNNSITKESFSNDKNNKFNKKKYFKSNVSNKIGLKKKYNLTSKNNKKFKIEKIYNSWKRSHSNNWNSKFLNSRKINEENVQKLKLVWQHKYILKKNNNWKENIEINPVFADGKVIYISADWKINVINAEDGKLIWSKQFIFKPTRRGFVYYDKYIFITSGNKLFKIKLENGELDNNFGKNGTVFVGNVLVAPNIYNNQIILTNTKGIVSLYNTKDGEKKFSLSINKDKLVSDAFIWGGSALDEEKMFYYAGVGNPKPGLYGSNRPGSNKNSSSLICINLKKKKIEWTFQETIHDLWDFDVASPPILAKLHFDEKSINVVIVTTKRGNVLIFERYTGEPLFDLNYQKPPSSNVPNEIVSDLQLKLEKPEKFSKIEFNLSDLDLDKLDNKNRKYFNDEIASGWLKPPTLGKDLIIYGLHGGNNWFGSAFNPYTHNIYIPTNNIPYVLRVQPKSKEKKIIVEDSYLDIYKTNCASCHGKTRNGIIDLYREYQKNYIPPLVGYTSYEPLKSKLNYKNYTSKHKKKISKSEFNKIISLFENWDNKIIKKEKMFMDNYWTKLLLENGEFPTKPPYGEIISLNVLSGNIDWKIPWGYKTIDGSEKKIGVKNNGGISINSGNLIFANGTDDSYASIFSQINGKELWKFKMDAPGSAPPLIFEHNGKQYVSFISTGLNFHDSKKGFSTLYTFSIK